MKRKGNANEGLHVSSFIHRRGRVPPKQSKIFNSESFHSSGYSKKPTIIGVVSEKERGACMKSVDKKQKNRRHWYKLSENGRNPLLTDVPPTGKISKIILDARQSD